MHVTAIPDSAIDQEIEDAKNDESKDNNPDVRISLRASDKRVVGDGEYSDSEDESDNRRDAISHKPKRKRPKMENQTEAADFTPAVKPEKSEKKESENDGTHHILNSVKLLTGIEYLYHAEITFKDVPFVNR